MINETCIQCLGCEAKIGEVHHRRCKFRRCEICGENYPCRTKRGYKELHNATKERLTEEREALHVPARFKLEMYEQGLHPDDILLKNHDKQHELLQQKIKYFETALSNCMEAFTNINKQLADLRLQLSEIAIFDRPEGDFNAVVKSSIQFFLKEKLIENGLEELISQQVRKYIKKKFNME